MGFVRRAIFHGHSGRGTTKNGILQRPEVHRPELLEEREPCLVPGFRPPKGAHDPLDAYLNLLILLYHRHHDVLRTVPEMFGARVSVTCFYLPPSTWVWGT